MALLTLQDAMDHLRITDSDHDRQVQTALDNAEGIISDYMMARWDPAWTRDTLPRVVYQAICLMIADCYENPGDDLQDRSAQAWAQVQRLLARKRDPAWA